MLLFCWREANYKARAQPISLPISWENRASFQPGTGFQALSQECRELALNQGPLVYEAEALTAGPLAQRPGYIIHRWKAEKILYNIAYK